MRFKIRLHLWSLLWGAIGTTGCVGMTPHVDAAAPIPIVDVGADWLNAASNTHQTPIDLTNWWASLNDPVLTDLIEKGLRQNLDIAQAKSRIDEARAMLAGSMARGQIELGVGGFASARVQSENGTIPIARLPGIDRAGTLFQTSTDASWEPDLWGGLKAEVSGAQARVAAAQADEAGVRVAITGEIARIYFELRAAQAELDLEQASTVIVARQISLINQRVRAGDLAHRDLDDWNLRMSQARARLPRLEGRARDAAIALSLLTGQAPEATSPLNNGKKPMPRLLSFPIGTPASVLARRPDIEAARQRLISRGTETRAARVESMPRLTIGAKGGFEAVNLTDILNPASFFASLGPSISWRILDNGKASAQISAANAREQNAAAAYSSAVLAALTDVERALSGYRSALDTLREREAAIAISMEIVAHAQRRFEAGDISRLELLDAQKQMSDLQTEAVRAQANCGSAMIGVFKALGGGW
jgi:NodT family efflux transporter outer membrane factor (OMF) lipoprotein